MIQHTFGLLVKPNAQWQTISKLSESSFKTLLLYPWFLAILPAVSWYYGTTQVGWSVGNHGDIIKLTTDSALQICILFYFTQVVCVYAIGYFIHWIPERWKLWIVNRFIASPLWAKILITILTVFVIYQSWSADLQPFIYFQF